MKPTFGFPGILLLLLALAPVGFSKPAKSEDMPQVRQLGMLSGVNLAGAEFNSSASVRGRDYNYPSDDELQNTAALGFKLVRVPVLIQRVTARTVSGDWELAPDMIEVRRIAATAARLKIYVVLDLHNYGAVPGVGIIGQSEEATQAFADIWKLLAADLRDEPYVQFGLMNEPNRQTPEQWFTGANRAIAAIRQAGARQIILVPGSKWTGASSWISSGNADAARMIKDPQNNWAIEVHQYLDGNSSGTSEAIIAGSGASRLVSFTKWARQNNVRAFLGEFGWGRAEQANDEGKAILAYMKANSDIWFAWAYWAGGSRWGNYPFAIDVSLRKTSPQLSTLQMFMNANH